MIELPIALLIALATMWAYALAIRTDKTKKDLDPRIEYPQVWLFKYYCIFAVSLVIFLTTGLVVGFAICGITMLIVILFAAYTENEYKKNISPKQQESNNGL